MGIWAQKIAEALYTLRPHCEECGQELAIDGDSDGVTQWTETHCENPDCPEYNEIV